MWGIVIGFFVLLGGIALASMLQLGLYGYLAAVLIGVALAIKAS